MKNGCWKKRPNGEKTFQWRGQRWAMKMGPGKRKPLRAHHSPEKPSCLSVHVQRRISQKARCCVGEIEADCSSSRDGLGCPDNWLTRGNISFAWRLFHLPTQFATSDPPTHTQKTHIKLCKKEQPRWKERRSKHTRTPHSFLCHRPSLCVACSQITCFEDRVLLREANYKNMVWLGNGEMVPTHSKVGCQVPCSFQCVY